MRRVYYIVFNPIKRGRVRPKGTLEDIIKKISHGE